MWVIESVKKGKTSRWYKKVETSVVFIKKMHTFIVPKMQIVNRLINIAMKRRILFFLVAMFLMSGISKTMAQTTADDLKGIWQMCFYMSSDPTLPGELKPSNSFKILSDDGKFTNMTVIPNKGAIIIGSGTYKLTAPNAFTEHVEKNLHLPQLVGVDNVLEFDMKGGEVMMVKFFVKKDPEGNEINSWYYETWKKVKMPATYPKDLVR